MDKWISVNDQLPPEGVVVETKLDDEKGERNVQNLKLYRRDARSTALWFFPDDSMYVYYTPTHWRPTAEQRNEQQIEANGPWYDRF